MRIKSNKGREITMFFTQLGRVAAGLASVILVSACAVSGLPNPVGSREIVLEGILISEDETNIFSTWKCVEYYDGWRTLVEVGIFSNPDLSTTGFVLYDGKNTGVPTSYQRQGLNRRWDWGSNGSRFSFIVEPDNTGRYYDFSSVPDGESTESKESYKCYQ